MLRNDRCPTKERGDTRNGQKVLRELAELRHRIERLESIVIDLAKGTPGGTVLREEEPSLIPTDSLTAREVQVLHLVARGMSNREIADNLELAAGTVKRHLSNIFEKLQVGNRTRAVARARFLKWL